MQSSVGSRRRRPTRRTECSESMLYARDSHRDDATDVVEDIAMSSTLIGYRKTPSENNARVPHLYRGKTKQTSTGCIFFVPSSPFRFGCQVGYRLCGAWLVGQPFLRSIYVTDRMQFVCAKLKIQFCTFHTFERMERTFFHRLVSGGDGSVSLCPHLPSWPSMRSKI